jgi:hypothetical protein
MDEKCNERTFEFTWWIQFYELRSINDPGGSLSRAFKLTEAEPAEGRRAPYASCGVKNIVWREAEWLFFYLKSYTVLVLFPLL